MPGRGVYVFLLCVVMAKAEMKGSGMSEVQFVNDYVRFYGIRDVCIVSEEENEWLRPMFQHLVRVVGTYTAVSSKNNEIENHNITRVLGGCRGLRIMRVYGQEEADLFREMFVDSETRMRWLLFCTNSSMKLLKNIYLPINSKVTLARLSEYHSSIILDEIYQVTQQLDQRIFPVGLWIPTTNTTESRITSDDLDPPIPIPIPTTTIDIPKEVQVQVKILDFGILRAPVDDPLLRRHDLTGLHIRCNALEYEPLIILKHQSDGTVLIDGVMGKVFTTLQQITNFTSTCWRVKDGQWGAVVNGEWTGMLREVKDYEVDIAVGPLGITLKRTAIVDFLIGIIASEIALRKPSNEDYMWTVYTKQFASSVWGMLILFTLSLVICLHYMILCSVDQPPVPLPDVAFAVVSFVFGQGTSLNIHSAPARIVMLTVLLLHVVVLGFYTSNLVSSLTVGPPLPPYQDLGDIHAQSSITFGIVKGSRNMDDFSDSQNPLYQSVWQRVKEEDLSPTADEGMKRVYSEKYAFMLWGIYYKVNYGQDCRAFTLPTGYFPTYTSFALAKGSPLVPLLNKLVLDILSTGLLTKWWNEINVATTDCSALETAPIEIKTVLTPFLLLGCATLLSFGIVGVELWIFRRKIRNV